MNKQMNFIEEETNVEKYEFKKPNPIQGYPELYWRGKRPFTSTQYYPAQLKERYGEEKDGWMNKIFWGDNLQVMSHMLKEYRGKIDLIYIDPPFDSKADYKKKIKLKGKEIKNDINSFEEKQYTDIWTNDEYLQFMYERLILIRELLSEDGSIYLHCDPHKAHYIKIIMDEVFGEENFLNDVIWCYKEREASTRFYNWKHDNILFYQKTKSKDRIFNYKEITEEYSQGSISKYNLLDKDGRKYQIRGSGGHLTGKQQLKVEDEEKYPQWTYRDYLDEKIGILPRDYFTDINIENRASKNRTGYPTQKPEALLERIIIASSNPGDIVFDCFMGSGTTQNVAMKLGRKFIGSDINLGSIHIATKRFINTINSIDDNDIYTGFEVYNVNNYDFFRNEVEAKDILIESLEIQKLPSNIIYDGEKDGRMVKIMPVNKITTRADLNELIANLPYKLFEERKNKNPRTPVEKITLICMGHEADLAAYLQSEVKFNLDIEVVDILRDKSNLEFKRDSEAEIVIDDNKLKIENFYPMNLLQKLSLMKENVEDWRELVESVMIDFNYDGVVMEPTITDVPDKKDLVIGEYNIPSDAGRIKVKITDVLSETFEWEGDYE